MSGFSSIAMPGGLPVSGGGRGAVTPEKLFSVPKADGESPRVKVKKVKVEIFDLSDPKQVRRYERLWKELLDKASKMEVVVDHHRDLVNRPDGSSYWMKYIEYVEFCEAPDDARQA